MEPRPMNTQKGVSIKADMHPMSAKFMIGDQELMVMGADIRMRPDEVITATLELPVEHIDIELMTSGVTIAPIGDHSRKTQTAYVVVSDDAPAKAVQRAIIERLRDLESRHPAIQFEIRVLRESDIPKS